jgi:hypothetical protein
MLLRISVGTINGCETSFAVAPLIRDSINWSQRCRDFQQAGGLNIRIEQQKDGEATIMALPVPPGASAMSADRSEIQRLLGLELGATDYSLTYGLTPRSPTRSRSDALDDRSHGGVWRGRRRD